MSNCVLVTLTLFLCCLLLLPVVLPLSVSLQFPFCLPSASFPLLEFFFFSSKPSHDAQGWRESSSGCNTMRALNRQHRKVEEGGRKKSSKGRLWETLDAGGQMWCWLSERSMSVNGEYVLGCKYVQMHNCEKELWGGKGKRVLKCKSTVNHTEERTTALLSMD